MSQKLEYELKIKTQIIFFVYYTQFTKIMQKIKVMMQLLLRAIRKTLTSLSRTYIILVGTLSAPMSYLISIKYVHSVHFFFHMVFTGLLDP